ncbi:MAG TPA: hypothetical protein VE224_04655 [Pseudolabrys sp.]|jgi:Spy/CpxP family protein refolding chaperone|nr:hypothetical protein [Pseudolabrys sp.]
MRHVLIAAAALAVCGFVASSAAQAQVAYQAGGPMKVGSMCKVGTDDRGDDSYGYYQPCGYQSVAEAPVKRRHRR